jgi:hypothetical protein
MNELLNGLGFTIGLALYTMLLVMVLRDRTRATPLDVVPLMTAILGIVWNLCSLSAVMLPRMNLLGAGHATSVVGVIALGFLPAVVVHSVARGRRGTTPRSGITGVLLAVAYGASAIAASVELSVLVFDPGAPSGAGLRILTWTFVALAVPLAIVTHRQPGGRRALWVSALAAFAVSALHLSELHEQGTTWRMELLGHHASIPLAIAILYQDYPFAFADLFLKRALGLIALVGLAIVGLTSAGLVGTLSPGQLTVLALGWTATGLAYPWLKRGSQWFVDSVVLTRPDYHWLETAVVRRLQNATTVDMVLEHMQHEVRDALHATAADWRTQPDESPLFDRPEIVVSDAAGVSVSIPTSERPSYLLTFGGLTGGRRVLSGDIAFLSVVASAGARRIDVIRITQERYERAVRDEETAKLATQAELQALRAQLNPHFLFNALTTIGYLIQTSPAGALQTLLRLTSLLRGVLRSEGEFTTLGRELDLVEAYLDIEKARFEERLRIRIDVPDDLRELLIPALILQPLVENAVKHGIGPRRYGGDIAITATQLMEPAACLLVRVADTGPGLRETAVEARRRDGGVGLRSIERRLACHYGDSASLTLTSCADKGTLAELRLPIAVAHTLRRPA